MYWHISDCIDNVYTTVIMSSINADIMFQCFSLLHIRESADSLCRDGADARIT